MRKVIEVHHSDGDEFYRVYTFENEKAIERFKFKNYGFAADAVRWLLEGMTVQGAIQQHLDMLELKNRPKPHDCGRYLCAGDCGE